jgi:hypothetical protein
MPTAARRHVTVTSCLGEPVLSGALSTPARPASEPPVSWALAAGYSPAAAAEGGWDPTSDFVRLDADGTWEVSLPVGGWSIPLVLSAGDYLPVRAWLDISVASSCELAYTCGPDLAPRDHRVLYPEGQIIGRILCPDGRPAGGARVQAWGMNSTWVTTDERGIYRLPSGWLGSDRVYITAVLKGYPDMVGGDPRGDVQDGTSDLYAPAAQRVRAPDYRFTQYSFLKGSIAVEGGVRDGGADAVRVIAWAVPTDGDPRWTFNSDGTKGPHTGDGGVGACLEYASSGNCARAGQDADGSYFVRVLPGAYRVGYSASWGDLYAEWHGSSELDMQLDIETPPATAAVVHVAPGATLDLGAKTLGYVAILSGSAFTSVDGITTTGISSVPLPVSVYARTAGGWELADMTSTFGGWASANWAIGVTPGEYRVVLNDPHAVGYDPDYDTVFAPGVHSLENANSIPVARGERVATSWRWNVVSRVDAAVKRGTVVGTVRNADGTPAVGAKVSLIAAASSYAATSGADGTFLVVAPEGRYTVHAMSPDGAGAWWGGDGVASATPVVVTAFADTAGVGITVRGGEGSPVAIASTRAPAVTGTPRVGVILSASSGGWSRPPDTIRYQWLSNGRPLPGATLPTYTVPASQLGARLSVEVSATAGGESAIAASAPTAAVSAGALVARTPTIAGALAVSSTVTAKPGAWTSGTVFAYQWFANGVVIRGATKATLKLGTAHKSKKISVRVTGKRLGFTSVTKTSASTGKVATAGTPKISGKAKVGKKLTAKPGTWTSGTKFSYQWYANGVAIKKATKSTLTLKSAQKGKKITVKVTGKKSGYATIAKTSKATAKVKR